MGAPSNKDIAEAQNLNKQGVAAAQDGRFKQAQTCFEQAINLCMKAKIGDGLVVSSRNLGNLLVFNLNEPRQSFAPFATALGMALRSGKWMLCLETLDVIINAAWHLRQQKENHILLIFAGKALLNPATEVLEKFQLSEDMQKAAWLACTAANVISGAAVSDAKARHDALELARKLDGIRDLTWRMEEFVNFTSD